MKKQFAVAFVTEKRVGQTSYYQQNIVAVEAVSPEEAFGLAVKDVTDTIGPWKAAEIITKQNTESQSK